MCPTNYFGFIFQPITWYIVLELILLTFTAYIIAKAVIFYKTLLMRFLYVLASFGFFVILTLIVSFIFVLKYLEPLPPSRNYHVLNAAIKNTCYLDPQRNHCPKTEDDLINIESERFGNLTRMSKLTYRYYPDTHQYTLIVREVIRNEFMAGSNSQKVALFDPRLASSSAYGHGVDFYDAYVEKCGDKYRLTEPPPFPGPWNEIN